MKISLLGLFLCLAAIAGGDGLTNIPIVGCYCDEPPGSFRSKPVMVVGGSYRFANGSRDAVSVIVMPGSVQTLGTVMPGQTVNFISGGTSLLVFSSGRDGEPVRGLRLERVLPMSRVNPKQPPAQ